MRIQSAVFWLIGFLVLAVFLAAMAPGVFWRDSLEFCLIGHGLDIGHPAGSPTFSLISKALSFVTLGSLAWRANLVSVLAAVAAILLLWQAVRRWVSALTLADGTAAWVAGGGAALLFGFSQSFWAWSEVAEVYALQAAVLAALLYLAASALDGELDVRVAGLIGLILGLSCGVHMVQILYGPAFAVALLLRSPWRTSWRGAWAMGLAFIVGFAVFAYLPVRSLTDLPYDYGNPETWSAFVGQITGRQYSGVIHRFPWGRIGGNLLLLPVHVWNELGPLGALAALLGLGALVGRSWRGAWLIGLIAAGHLYLYIKDWSKAFGYIPIFLLASLLAGIGLAWAWRRLGDWLGEGRRPALTVALAAVALTGGLWNFAAHLGYCDRSGHDLADRHGRAILDSLPTDAVLVGYQDHLAYNAFFQQNIERWREDVQFVHRAWLPFPDKLAQRFPAWDLTGYDPSVPLSAEAMLRANAGAAGAFWDYGWERAPWIDPRHLEPYGLVYRLTDRVWDGVDPPADRALWGRTLAPIYGSRLLPPTGYDWTAQEVYARAFHLRAKLHTGAGRWKQAESAERAAVAVRDDFAESHAFVGLILLAQKRLDEAYQQLNRAVELDPYCAVCLAARGQFRVHLNEKQGALADYRAAYRLEPGNGDDDLALAQLLVEAGQMREADAVLDQVARLPLDTRQQVQLPLLRAAVSLRRRDCRQMDKHLSVVEALAPGHPAIEKMGAACRSAQNL